MTGDDDMDDVLHRIEALARADRFLSGSSATDCADDDWSEVAPILAAARGPAAGDELVGVDATIDTFVGALGTASIAALPRRPVLRKLLTGKAIAGIAVASLITAGTAAAATGQFHGKDRGVVSPNAMSDSFVRPTTRANAESDPSTTSATTSTSTSTSTTSTTVVSSPTVVAPPATHGGGIGPDVNGPAKHGLCTAYLASLDHDPKNVSAPPFRNLVQAAVDAGQTVQEFCADVMGTTSTSSDNADQGNNGHGDRSGHSGKAGNDHSGD